MFVKVNGSNEFPLGAGVSLYCVEKNLVEAN
jgi:hypothetical protein